MLTCPVCNQTFTTDNDIFVHFRKQRKNFPHSTYINEWVKLSFYENNSSDFLKKKYLSFSKQSLNEKWKRWYSREERKKRGNNLISLKNSGRKLDENARKKVSDGLKRAYKNGTKISALKGKPAHNKGKPCSEEQKKKISQTLRDRYCSGDIEIVNHGNDFQYGYRKGIKHFCRSSWEANFARFLSFHRIEYLYEKHRFTLILNGQKMLYIPDFFLVKTNTFVEIKGRYDEYSKLKHRLFKEQYPQYKLAILPREKYFKIERRLCRHIPDWELSRNNIYLIKHLIKSENYDKE